MRDGKRGKHAPPIGECPHCGQRLSLRTLDLHPPSNLPSNLLWWPDQRTVSAPARTPANSKYAARLEVAGSGPIRCQGARRTSTTWPVACQFSPLAGRR
jgi:hypothetical protein